MSYESLQKELSSKSAAERAQTRTIELQVSSMEKDLQQKVMYCCEQYVFCRFVLFNNSKVKLNCIELSLHSC